MGLVVQVRFMESPQSQNMGAHWDHEPTGTINVAYATLIVPSVTSVHGEELLAEPRGLAEYAL